MKPPESYDNNMHFRRNQNLVERAWVAIDLSGDGYFSIEETKLLLKALRYHLGIQFGLSGWFERSSLCHCSS